MSVGAAWQTLQDECEALAEYATLLTPLSGKEFTITSIQYPPIVITYRDGDDSQPLQREQFETLIRRVKDAAGGFNLGWLPPDAGPYAAILMSIPASIVNHSRLIVTLIEVY